MMQSIPCRGVWGGGREGELAPATRRPLDPDQVAHKQTNSYLYINLFGMFHIFLLENQLWTAALFKERYKWFHKLTKWMMQHWDDIITVWLDTQSIVMKLPLVILVLCLRLECSIDCISGSVSHQQNIFRSFSYCQRFFWRKKLFKIV